MRLLFEKEGVAVWISHLDLMRLLARAFRRAGIRLKHSQGFTPHPELSVVMPLSVGVSSVCELADFTLAEGETVTPVQIPARMNPVLPAGLRVLDCYEGGQKAGRLALLRSRLMLVYDPEAEIGVAGPQDLALNVVPALRALFARPALVVEKHSKKGPVETDLAPMIREIAVSQTDDRTLCLELLGTAQNPTLNPLLLITAIENYLPECKPNFVTCHRLEIYDAEGKVFR